MNVEYFFDDPECGQPQIEVTQPVKNSYLIRNAFTWEEIITYFQDLSVLPWTIQEIIVAGKAYMPMRETLGFADRSSPHLLENRTSKSLPYSTTFDYLRTKIQSILKLHLPELEQSPEMNYCWGNRYRDGRDKVGKHKDDDKNHSKIDPIVSLSFGATRFFDIHEYTKRIERVNLGNGDIFLMMPGFQQRYFHGIPPQLKIKDPRINLTFRTIIT